MARRIQDVLCADSRIDASLGQEVNVGMKLESILESHDSCPQDRNHMKHSVPFPVSSLLWSLVRFMTPMY
jgi:hypothetical protein